MQSLEILIAAYMQKAEVCSLAMKNRCGGMHPVRAWRERRIAAQGQIECPERCSYTMHGIGCLFTADKWAVDVDFDTYGKCGGFDAWRLAQFAKSLFIEDRWPLARIDSEVKNLLKKRILMPVADSPCNHLLKLA